MSAGVAAVAALVLTLAPSFGGSVSAPRVTINNGTGHQFDPHVDGDLVAYSVDRVGDDGNLYLEIRYYRFSTGQDVQVPPLQLPDGTYALDLLSDVSNGRIIFSRMLLDRTALMLFDTATQTFTELAYRVGSNYLGVSIAAQTVAYIDFGTRTDNMGELFVLDLNTGVSSKLTNDAINDQNPTVTPDGTIIAWERCPLVSNCDIYTMTRTSTGWQPAAVGTDPRTELMPESNGSIVVWFMNQEPTPPYGTDIWFAPTSGGGLQEPINIVGNQFNPSIQGNFIVFQNTDGTPNAQSDVFVLNLATNAYYQVTQTPDLSEIITDLSILSTGELRVVWEAQDIFGERDVYGATLVVPSATGGTGGGAGGGIGHGSGPGGGPGCQARDVTLVAERVYSPTRATDAVQQLSPAYTFAIPAQIPVVAGNSGNKKVVLTIDLGGQALRCQYRGGSPKAHPTTPQDLAAAQAYHFVNCSTLQGGDEANGFLPNNAPNYVAGSVVTASSIRLHVQGGDSKQPLTRVRLELSEECLQSGAASLEDGQGLAPGAAGCSSTSSTLTPMLAMLVAMFFFLRRPAAIRLVSRQERRRLPR